MVANQIIYNQISPELKDKIRVLKGDETMTFRLLTKTTLPVVDKENVKTNMPAFPAWVTIPNVERIFDPFLQDFVDIAYVTGYAPATRDGFARPNLGTIAIENPKSGTLTLTRRDNALAAHLQLSSHNKDCVNPAHEMPQRGYLIEEVKPAVTDQELFTKDVQITHAKAKILEMKGQELDVMRENFRIPTVENKVTLTEEQIKLRLFAIANDKPELIINATSDVAGRIRGKIRTAEQAQVIEFNEDNDTWVWGDSKEVITTIAPNAHPENALLSYLQNNRNAPAVLTKIETMLNAKAESKKR